MRTARFLALIGLIAVSSAQPRLELKGAKIAIRHQGSGPQYPLKRNNLARRHLIVQYPHTPLRAQLQKLENRGASLLEYVPEFAYVISAPDRMSTEGLGLYWSGIVLPAEKVSPAFPVSDSISSSPYYALIDFYSDVNMSDARAIVLNCHLTLQEDPDLLTTDLLAYGSAEEFAALAQWDEVEYIFPASSDVINGTPVYSCAGALTSQGIVGQSVAIIGGWVPAGGSASLNYAFTNMTSQLPADAAEAEIARAFSTWAKYAQVSWTQTSQATGADTVAVLFATGDHGDGYPFSPPILAHTFYPYPVNPEPIAGDMHFNDGQSWHIGSDVDLFSVALHEAGHALGLGHTDVPGAVMYPYYHQATDLSQTDIDAILTLYAAQTGTQPTAPADTPLTLTVTNPGATTASAALILTGTTSGGSGTVGVTWSSDQGGSGTAVGSGTWTIAGILLNTGANTVTVTATDAQHSQVSQAVTITFQPTPVDPATPAAPVLQITSPAAGGNYRTSLSTILLAGTAADSTGISRVTWLTSSGANGVATGTSNWSAGPISLVSGTTTITVTAYATNGQTATESLQVSYAAAPPSTPTGPDTTAPALAILKPVMTTVSVTGNSIAFSGTASDNVGVTSITWSTSNGDSGIATGTKNWSVPAIPLLVGINTVTIRAFDAAGNSSWRSVMVTSF